MPVQLEGLVTGVIVCAVGAKIREAITSLAR